MKIPYPLTLIGYVLLTPLMLLLAAVTTVVAFLAMRERK